MATYLYRLQFKGAVHFGLAGISLEAVEEHLSSDSLTSAVLNAFSILEGDQGVTGLINALSASSPPFIFSSLFPYGPDPETPTVTIEALIKPMINPLVEKKEILRRNSKDLKRIRYLHPRSFLSWIGSNPLTDQEVERIVLESKDLIKGWWQEIVRPRVALDRQNQGSSLWGQAGIWFSKRETNPEGIILREGAGLYGLVHFYDETWKARLESAFRILGDTGLGGEKTYGMGLFNFGGFEAPPLYWQKILSEKSILHVFLSRYYPAESERSMLKDSLIAWDFAETRGFIVSGRNSTNLKRKRIRMLVEGSVAQTRLKGALVNVTPDRPGELGLKHGIYRSGIAFLAPRGGQE